MIAPMSRLESLRPLAQAASRLALPVGLAEALEAKRTFERRGLGPTSLRTYRQAWLSRLHLLPVDLDLTTGVVVDVGANEGNFSNAVLALAPHAHVIAVEPSPGPRARLEARLGANPNLKIVGSALAATAGTADAARHRARPQQLAARAARGDADALRGPGLVGGRGHRGADPARSTTSSASRTSPRSSSTSRARSSTSSAAAGARSPAPPRCCSRSPSSPTTRTTRRSRSSTPTMREHGFDLIAMSEPGRNDEGVVTWADACYARRPA